MVCALCEFVLIARGGKPEPRAASRPPSKSVFLHLSMGIAEGRRTKDRFERLMAGGGGGG